MLLVLLRAVVAACEREDQRVVALQLAEPSLLLGVIGQLVVRKYAARHDVGTHGVDSFRGVSLTSVIRRVTCAHP